MKYKHIKAAVLAGMWLAAGMFTGCSKDDGGLKLPERFDPQTLELGRWADYYEVEVPGNWAWEVESSPAWATPAENAGEAGTKLSLYVESNAREDDRSDTLKIHVEGEKLFCVALRQEGSLSAEDNGAIEGGCLDYAYGVGFGIDVLAPSSVGKYNILFDIINPEKLAKALAERGESEAYSEEPQYTSRTDSYVGTTTSSISNQLSVNAGVDVEIAGFKVSVDAAYSSHTASNEKSGYAMQSIKHVTGSRYLRSGMVRSLVQEGVEDIFTADFQYYVDELKGGVTKDKIADLVKYFGTHLVTYGSVGCEMQIAMEMHSTETVKESDLHAALELGVKAIGGGGSVDMSESEKNISESTKVSLEAYGGDTRAFRIAPNSPFETLLSETLSASALDKWVSDVRKGGAVAIIDIQTIPIYDLIADPAIREAVKDYIVNDYQKQVTGQTPQLYAVSGFDRKDLYYGELYIPEIDVRLEAYSELIPEISATKPSTVVYSGTEGEMSYDCGFFIGSDEVQPGKLRKQRDGSYKFEPFEGLERGLVSELYVDASGEVTIAPKTLEDGVYTDREFEVITEDAREDWLSDKLHAPGHENDHSCSTGIWGESTPFDDFFYFSNGIEGPKTWYYVEEKACLGCVSKDLSFQRDIIDQGNVEAILEVGCKTDGLFLYLNEIVLEFYSAHDKNTLISSSTISVNEDRMTLKSTYKVSIPKGTRLIVAYMKNEYASDAESYWGIFWDFDLYMELYASGKEVIPPYANKR